MSQGGPNPILGTYDQRHSQYCSTMSVERTTLFTRKHEQIFQLFLWPDHWCYLAVHTGTNTENRWRKQVRNFNHWQTFETSESDPDGEYDCQSNYDNISCQLDHAAKEFGPILWSIMDYSSPDCILLQAGFYLDWKGRQRPLITNTGCAGWVVQLDNRVDPWTLRGGSPARFRRLHATRDLYIPYTNELYHRTVSISHSAAARSFIRCNIEQADANLTRPPCWYPLVRSEEKNVT